MRVRQASVVLTLLAAGACAGAPPVREPAGKPLFMWEVVPPAGGAPSYLLGSIHILPTGRGELVAPIFEAYERTQVLAVEIDTTTVNQVQMAALTITRGMYAPPDGLEQHLSESDYRRAVESAEAAGLPELVTQRMRPWLLAVTLSTSKLMALGYSEDKGIDHQFLTRAHRAGAGKTIVSLESVELQLDLFVALSPEAETAMLMDTIDAMSELHATIDKTLTAWEQGDAEAMGNTLFAGMAENPAMAAFYEAAFYDRNEKMADAIASLVTGPDARTAFVVVGAGHIVGDRGLVALLRERGYQVTQARNRADSAAF